MDREEANHSSLLIAQRFCSETDSISVFIHSLLFSLLKNLLKEDLLKQVLTFTKRKMELFFHNGSSCTSWKGG